MTPELLMDIVYLHSSAAQADNSENPLTIVHSWLLGLMGQP